MGISGKWGVRKHSVDHDDTAQWFADVNGDGMADYVYERDDNDSDNDEYRVMLSKGDQFDEDTSWGTKDHSVENSGQSQWVLDINGDGLPDSVRAFYDTSIFDVSYLEVRYNTGSNFDTTWARWGVRRRSQMFSSSPIRPTVWSSCPTASRYIGVSHSRLGTLHQFGVGSVTGGSSCLACGRA